jgi:hypothetical protein
MGTGVVSTSNWPSRGSEAHRSLSLAAVASSTARLRDVDDLEVKTHPGAAGKSGVSRVNYNVSHEFSTDRGLSFETIVYLHW